MRILDSKILVLHTPLYEFFNYFKPLLKLSHTVPPCSIPAANQEMSKVLFSMTAASLTIYVVHHQLASYSVKNLQKVYAKTESYVPLGIMLSCMDQVLL